MKKKWRSWLFLAVPYLMTALIPVISVLFLGNMVLENYEEKLISDRQHSLQVAQDRLQQNSDTIEQLAVMLGSNDVLNRYSAACLNRSGHTPLDFMELKKLLSNASFDPIIHDIFIYDKKDDSVISANTALNSTETFFRYYYMVEGLTYLESMERLDNLANVHSYCPEITLSIPASPGSSKQVVEYRMFLPIGWVRDMQCQLVVAIDAEELFKDFRDALPTGGEFYVYDSNNVLIYSSGSLYRECLSLTASDTLHSLDSGDTQLHGAVLRSGKWKVKVIVPNLAESGGRLSFLAPSFLLFVILPMLTCLLLTIFFTHKNYRSIYELVSLFRTHTGEQSSEPKIVDYRLVQQYAGQVIAEKDRMTRQISEYSHSRKYQILDKLVRNTYQTREEAVRALEETDLSIRDSRNMVLCLSCPGDSFDTLVSGGTTVRETVRRLVSDLLDQPYVLFDLSARETACIISLEEEDTPDFLIQGIVSHLNVEVNYRHGVEILVGAGNPTQRIHRLGDSLEQARAVIRYRELSGSHVSLYSQLLQLEDLYYYPREYDEKILDYVVAGKKDEAIALVRKIYEEHFEKEGSLPSVRAINAIKSRLWDCVVSIAEKYGIAREELEMNDQGQSIARIRGEMSARRYFALICEKIDMLAQKIQEKKSTGQNTLVKRIMEYVQEHYCCSELSLKQLSGALGVHENYISNLFKSAYGENLSSYVEKLRIEKSCELIRGTSMKIEEIAGCVGYTSGASFRRAFKKVKGISPAEYREK